MRMTLVESALEAGYAAQSHFIRGFRAAMGEAPRRFLEAHEYCGSGENANDEWVRMRGGPRAGRGAIGPVRVPAVR
jgi:AraC-like DNA-binding protein